ncbi:MAG TPA: aminopeptidase N [Wenzhouxiangellaceae bacterium]|nr:aminopeptidase N [Wenzhouxiangellaceae bacterium]HKL54322.1 aminopeptidase N [Wenzhouxiangellaceae bacterium]
MKALKGDAPRTPINRADYRPPAWLIDTAVITLDLNVDTTCVSSSLRVRRNHESDDTDAPLVLFGDNLETECVAIDGRELDADAYRLDDGRLTIGGLEESAIVTTRVLIHPAKNTALEGLYQSGSSLLTQCEAEGFRKITWFGDRPDIMTRFHVRLEADREKYPVLLGNGNLVECGRLDGNRHFAVWDDPFPKPSYLFALVAGDLGCKEDTFTTVSGRQVALKVYSERENLDQLEHAIESLKKSMAWDEQRFGLEYDLDVYHIVATHHFNMGAMENKSLNIFNARYVLADPDTATDADFEAIEAVIAHEYFHNWTGNRVTCRDWFQLTLKEGLTVFRDQEFSSDMQSRAVKRISDIKDLMARQFPEDAGPMAHPVRPERYVEINNFYTATVYEKGAEVVRMYDTLLGTDGFRRGMDLYFERHDGQAVTCDDFRAAMADANDADLGQFERWYRQVGTPTVKVETDYDEQAGALEISLTQSLPDHPDNADLGPLHIPFRLGLLAPGGASLSLPLDGEDEIRETHLLELRDTETTVRFTGLDQKPIVSLLRGFSAPVKVEAQADDRELAVLLAFDPDPVARWMAGRKLSARVLDRAIEAHADGDDAQSPDLLVSAWRKIVENAKDDPALAAALLQLPTEPELAQNYKPVPVDAIHAARSGLRRQLAESLAEPLREILDESRPRGGWRFDADDIAARSLANTALSLLVGARDEEAAKRAVAVYKDADNMTDRFAALASVAHARIDAADALLADFEKRYGDNPLVMDKWFAVQAQVAADSTVDKVEQLMDHPAFSMKNPNKVRSLIGTFGMHNPSAFHRANGSGYRLMGKAVRTLDSLNPQVAARLVSVFNRWADYDEDRKRQMREQLQAIKAVDGLSPDVDEIVSAALKREG